MLDKIKIWLRSTFSFLNNENGTSKYEAFKTSAEQPAENVQTIPKKIVYIAGAVLPLGLILIALFYVLRFLYKKFLKRPVRRKKRRTTSIVSRIRRVAPGSGKGSMAMKRRMAFVRSARRKKARSKKK